MQLTPNVIITGCLALAVVVMVTADDGEATTQKVQLLNRPHFLCLFACTPIKCDNEETIKECKGKTVPAHTHCNCCPYCECGNDAECPSEQVCNSTNVCAVPPPPATTQSDSSCSDSSGDSNSSNGTDQ